MSGGKILSFAIGFMLSNEKARAEVMKKAKLASAYVDKMVNEKFFNKIEKESSDDGTSNGNNSSECG